MTKQELQKQEKFKVEYMVRDEKLSLTANMVQQFVLKGNANLTEVEATNFMMLCKYAKLNPFMNEAYLIKFGSQPAQMVVSKEAFMKRANRHPQYNGLEAGIVVLRGENVVQKEGQTVYPGEQLLGGWARVYRKDIEHPIFVEVSLSEFNKSQSTWKSMPATMIRKVAIVNALREAFPDDLGAMYTEDDSIQNHNHPVKQVEKAPVNDLAVEFKQLQEHTKPVEVVTNSEPEQMELDMVEANRSAYEKEREMKQVVEQQELL